MFTPIGRPQYFLLLVLFGRSAMTEMVREEPEVEEPLWAARSVFFEFEIDEVPEPKALTSDDLRKLIKKHGSSLKTSVAIGPSEAFVRQNAKKPPKL